LFQGSEELFLVDPLAPSGSSRSGAGSSSMPRFPFLAEAVRRAAANARDLLNNVNDGESMAIDNDDDNASEHEDVPADRELPITVRQSSLNENETVEAAPYQQESRGIQGEESDPELDLLAETESDSDDNHSNQDAASAQRSVQTGATAGSDTGKCGVSSERAREMGDWCTCMFALYLTYQEVCCCSRKTRAVSRASRRRRRAKRARPTNRTPRITPSPTNSSNGGGKSLIL
jgi:E3 ubiquitin-protein ligase EDD1